MGQVWASACEKQVPAQQGRATADKGEKTMAVSDTMTDFSRRDVGTTEDMQCKQ